MWLRRLLQDQAGRPRDPVGPGPHPFLPALFLPYPSHTVSDHALTDHIACPTVLMGRNQKQSCLHHHASPRQVYNQLGIFMVHSKARYCGGLISETAFLLLLVIRARTKPSSFYLESIGVEEPHTQNGETGWQVSTLRLVSFQDRSGDSQKKLEMRMD